MSSTCTDSSSLAISSVDDLYLPRGTVSVEDLPNEILREIFILLDGISLAVCRKVCSVWKDSIDDLFKNPSFAYKLCNKEIPSWAIMDILDKIFPDHWQNQHSVDWKVINACWCQWTTLNATIFSIKKLISRIEGISCIQVSGDWLLISTCHRKGKLIAVRLRDCKKQEIYVGCNPILRFELVICDDACKPNLTSSRQGELEQFFDTIAHNEIWLEYRHCYIKLGRNYIVTLDKSQQTIRHSYGYRLKIIDSDIGYQVLYLQKVSNKINGPLVIEKEMPAYFNENVNFWANKISHWKIRDSDAGIVVVNINMKSQDITNSLSYMFDLKHSSYFSTYTWQNTIFFTYTDAYKLLFHDINGYKVHEIPFIKGYITCTLFYCNHLLMGTNKGLLMIYKVEKPEDCGNIQPFETESYDIQVSREKITNITIAEPVHHKGKMPMIICASSENVYEVTFPV